MKYSCSFTLNSIYKSPLGPPFTPAEPFPDNLSLVPVSTPAGILISSSFVTLTLPSPLQLVHVLS